ncbi:MAG: molybdopterin-dependent oxidoreductase, partial [Candidatus Jordarchaeaceae archaeon]
MDEQILTNCTVGGPVFVHVRDGIVTKIRPIVFDENDPQPWEIEARNKKFSPPRKVALNPYVLTERARIYSDMRIKYPMKRLDFDPEGKRNPQNRGKSGYERISWKEALDIILKLYNLSWIEKNGFIIIASNKRLQEEQEQAPVTTQIISL